MSLFHRLAHSTRPVGRAYSSFFSSKPGGGRHLKPVLQPGRAKVDNTNTAAEPTATSPPANTGGVVKAASDENPSNKPPEPLPQPSAFFALPSAVSSRAPIHPTISSKEYKLHQFFSLHRPLLLLNQDTSAIFEAVDPSTPLFTFEDHANGDLRDPFATIDNPPESSPDADADAARQLAHALVMNQVGGTIAWRQVLSRLGLSANSESDMSFAKETAQEWVTIHADSTRRKKRKKMKKHKLKKRRRLTRRQSK